MLTEEQIQSFSENGYLVLPKFTAADGLQALKQRAETIVHEFDPSAVSIFSTRNQTRTTDNKFLDSASGVDCFFEEKAFDANGNLLQPKLLSINKIGHAMHDVDTVFRQWSRSSAIAELLMDLGHQQPTPVQSMYIFKQPRIGGEVVPHQDSSFLYTTPSTCIGLWLAIEDANKVNGCLWAIPGSHRGTLARRFIKSPDGAVSFDKPPAEYDLSQGLPLEVAAGTLVVLHGHLVHWSSENTSDVSRHAYSMHLVDGTAQYSPNNWLQRDATLPFQPLADQTAQAA